MGGDPTKTGYPVALHQSGAVRSGTGAPALALFARGPGYARRVRRVIECFGSRARAGNDRRRARTGSAKLERSQRWRRPPAEEMSQVSADL